jgi:hypothetical protein
MRPERITAVGFTLNIDITELIDQLIGKSITYENIQLEFHSQMREPQSFSPRFRIRTFRRICDRKRLDMNSKNVARA